MQFVTDENDELHSFPDDATPDEMNAAIGSMPQPNGYDPKASFGKNFVNMGMKDVNSVLDYPAEVGKAETAGIGNAMDFFSNLIPGMSTNKPTPATDKFAKDYQSGKSNDLLSEGHAAFNEGMANSPAGEAMGALSAFPPFAMVSPLVSGAINIVGNIAKDAGLSKDEVSNTANTAMMIAPALHFMKPAPFVDTIPTPLRTGAGGEPLLASPDSYKKAMDIVGAIKPDLTDDITKMQAAKAQGTSPTLLDQNPDDENLKALAQVTANASPSATKMSSEVSSRSSDLGDDIQGLLKSNFGDYSATKTAAKEQMAASRPAYEKAYEGGSMAPLETQFGNEFARTSGNVADAAANLKDANNRLTMAEANLTQTGGNVYAESAARQAKTEAQNALDQAQKQYDAANQDHQKSLDLLKQAQSDRANGVKGGVWSPAIGEALQMPEVQAGIKTGLKNERLTAYGEDRPFNAKDYAITGKEANGDPIVSSVPNMRLLDTAKNGLDSMIEGEKKDGGGFTKQGVALIKFKNRYVDELDKVNPDYAIARKTYGDPASEKQYLEMGRDFKNMDDADIAEVVGKANPRNQQAFATGAGKYLSDAVNKAGTDAGALKKLLNDDTLNKLRPAFGDDVKFNAFKDNLDRLQNQSSTNKTLNYGKDAANRAEAQAQVDATNKSGVLGLGRKAVDAMLHPVKTSAELADSTITKAQGNIPRDVSTIVTRILTTKDPDVLKYVHNYNTTKPAPIGIRTKVGNAVAGQMANPLAIPGIGASRVQQDNRKANQ